jgi:ABC-type amino acid transport substrate-binding protein
MPSNANSRALTIAIVAAALAVLALALSFRGTGSKETKSIARGLLERVDESGELHAGYGVYPPYTQEDPNTHAVSGFSVDVINQIAAELKCKVVWHRLNWNTMSADLKRGEFDVIADPIFQTIPRAREFAFTRPYAYFADGIAVVRQTETRFTNFESLDQEGITIAVGQGWASETLVKSRFSKARIVPTQTSTDLLQVFNEVLAGRADVAVADGADASRFVKAHVGKVRALFLDNPPAYMPAGFAVRPDDRDGAEFLSVALLNLEATGVLDGLAKRYDMPSVRGPRQQR